MNPRNLFSSSPLHAVRVLFSAALLAVACPADATLVYNLEAIAVNGSPLSGGSTSKNVFINSGDLVSFEVFAFVTGAVGNSAAEGFQSGLFSIRSSFGGGIAASFDSGFSLTPNFSDPIFYPGFSQDLDGDGDLDIGSNSTSGSGNADPLLSAYNFIDAHSAGMTTAGTSIPNGTSFLLGSTTATVGSVEGTATITVNVAVPTFTGTLKTASRALWVEDGISKHGITGTFDSGIPVTLSAATASLAAPEPGTGILLGLSIAGYLSRRWRSRR